MTLFPKKNTETGEFTGDQSARMKRPPLSKQGFIGMHGMEASAFTLYHFKPPDT